jgi:Holliday junction resolvase RusA-like endonuclease
VSPYPAPPAAAYARVLAFTVPGRLQAWQRAGMGKGRFFTRDATRTAEGNVGWNAIQQCGKHTLLGPLTLAVTVYSAVPASWARKRQRAALAGLLRPTGRPDCDNLLKTICDGLNGVLWGDDAQVVDAWVSKRFAATAYTTVVVGQYEGENG